MLLPMIQAPYKFTMKKKSIKKLFTHYFYSKDFKVLYIKNDIIEARKYSTDIGMMKMS